MNILVICVKMQIVFFGKMLKSFFPEKADVLTSPLVVADITQNLLDEHNNPNLVVFVDIGGNRELEILVALLPWVASSLP